MHKCLTQLRQIFFKARKSVVREDLMEEKRKKKNKKILYFWSGSEFSSSLGSRSYLEFKKVKTKSQAKNCWKPAHKQKLLKQNRKQKTIKTKSQAKTFKTCNQLNRIVWMFYGVQELLGWQLSVLTNSRIQMTIICANQ